MAPGWGHRIRLPGKYADHKPYFGKFRIRNQSRQVLSYPVHTGGVLGFVLDSSAMSVSLPDRKIVSLPSLVIIRSWSVRLARFNNFLSHRFSGVGMSCRSICYGLYQTIGKGKYLALAGSANFSKVLTFSAIAVRDLHWWQATLEAHTVSKSLLHPLTVWKYSQTAPSLDGGLAAARSRPKGYGPLRSTSSI